MTTPRPLFVDWNALSEASLPNELQAAIDAADWSHFDTSRDLPELRARLDRLARKDGVGALHRHCTEKLRERGAELRHRVGHTDEHLAFGLSPDGRYLATGSWVGADYDKGGALQIWEVATGRAVNALPGINGGIGWPGYPRCIQWSPSGNKVGAAFSTNSVGDFNPFGQSSEPGTWVATTSGWDSPPAWCWRPDGQAVAVGCWGPSPIPGCIAEVPAGAPGANQVYEDTARWFADDISDEHADEEGNLPEMQPQKWLRFSQDGSRLYGHNSHRQAYAIDLESGELAWVSQVGEHVAWSPDDALFAHDVAGLVFYDAQTGMPTVNLPMHMGGSQLSWSPQADQRLLAMVVEPDNRFGADPAVHLYENGEFLGTVEVEPGAPGDCWDFEDAQLWAWAPDGKRAACLTAESTVEIWQVGAVPEAIRSIEVSSKTAGILWGADDTLICIGKEVVEFWDIQTASLRAAYDHGDALAAYGELVGQVPSPLEFGPGHDLSTRWRISPVFAMGEGDEASWILALDQGVVVCPEKLQDRLADELCWVLDNRFSWPFSWGDATVFANIEDALDAPDLPFDDHEKEALLETAAKSAEGRVTELALGSPTSLDALFETHLDALEQLTTHQRTYAGEQFREVAIMHARRGETEQALDAAGQIIQAHEAIAAHADIAIVLAQSGDKETAAKAHTIAEKLAETPVDDFAATFAYAPLAAANHLLGDKERARDLFEKAREFVQEEANPFQRYLALARGYMAVGDFDAAEAVIADGPWDGGGFLSMFLRAYIIDLAEYGQFDRVDHSLDQCEAAGIRISEFDLANAIVDALIDHQEFDRAWQVLDRFSGLSVTHYRERIVDAMVSAGRVDQAREKSATFERTDQRQEVAVRGTELEKAIARAKNAANAGDDEAKERHFAQARTLAVDGSRDKRFALSDVQSAQLEVGDLAGAYQTLRKQTPSNRVYEMHNLLDACVKAGEYGAAIQLLGHLPSENPRDIAQKTLRALRLAVYGHNRRPQW